MTDEKKGMIRKFGDGGVKYISRRFGNQFINKVGKDSLTGSYQAAKDTLKIKTASREELLGGFYGRYADGGRARFTQMMHMKGIKEDELPGMAAVCRRDALITFAGGVLFLAIGAWSILNAAPAFTFIYTISTMVVSLVLFAVGLRHDFARWQIEQRRFGGFREYFTGKPTGTQDKVSSVPATKD